MAEAGSLGIAETRPDRGICPQLQRVVERVRRQLGDDVSLLDELLEAVDRALAEQRKRSDHSERHAVVAAGEASALDADEPAPPRRSHG